VSAPRTVTGWLTVTQVCADLQVTEAEWHRWRESGTTPLHAVLPDGTYRVRVSAYERWLDSRTDATEADRTPPVRTDPAPVPDSVPTDVPAAVGRGSAPVAAICTRRLALVPDPGAGGRECRWCHHPLPAAMRIDAEYCSVGCRKAAWRKRTGRS
jgi:hypothetical protein